MTPDDEDVPPGRTITDADARAIAKALFTEATREILIGTGRSVWASIKTITIPLLLAAIIWWMTMQNQQITIPSHSTGIH